MEHKTLMRADYLDIIFDRRNKNYGSYQLRRYYGTRLGKAVVILYSMLAVVILLAVFRKPSTNNFIEPRTEVVANPTLFADVKKPPLPPNAVKPATQHPAKGSTKTSTEPDITNDPIPDNKQMTANKELTSANVGSGNAVDTADISPGMPGGTTTISGTVPVDTKPDKPFIVVGQMPAFDGDITKYLSSHIHYPEVARQNGIEGKVGIEFVVNEDGSVSNARVVRSVGGGCDEEALRVVSGMPKWRAGKHNGVPVKVYYALSIRFELQ